MNEKISSKKYVLKVIFRNSLSDMRFLFDSKTQAEDAAEKMLSHSVVHINDYFLRNGDIEYCKVEEE